MRQLEDAPATEELAWTRATRRVTPLLGSRLLQFAFFCGLIFAIAPKREVPSVIDVSSDRLAALRAAEAARTRAKTLPGEGGSDVDEREIEDEILYREGLRLGLDKNDGIVRQRIVQKVLFLAEETAGASRPADEPGLRAFFDKNRDRWAVPASVRFTQVYRHRPEALAAWASLPQAGQPPAGEPCPAAPEVDEDRARITAHFGAGFAEALLAAPPGTWAGPIASAFGWHLVRVEEVRPARPAQLDEVRGSVVEAYSVFRRHEATAAFIESAFARYQVAIDGKKMTHIAPSGRLAFRSAPSGED